MKAKTLLAAIAVSSLALAQPAAAATRSFDSVPAQGAKSAATERLGSMGSEAEQLRGGSIWIILLIAAIVAGIIVLTTDSEDAPASP